MTTSGIGATNVFNMLDNLTATIIYNTATSPKRDIFAWGVHVGNGSNWKLQWCQGTSSGNATRVYAGSQIRYRQVD